MSPIGDTPPRSAGLLVGQRAGGGRPGRRGGWFAASEERPPGPPRGLRLALASLAASTALVGCPSVHPRPDGALSSADEVLEHMHDRARAVRSLSAYARVSYFDDDGAKKARMDLVVARPASLSFAALTPTSDLIAALSSDGTRFVSFQRGADRCFTGPACRANVGRLLPLGLEGRDAVEVLTGGAPVMEHTRAELAWDESEGAYRVTLWAPNGDRERVWVEHGTWRPRRVDLYRGARRVFSLDLEDPQRVGGVVLPHRLHLVTSRRHADLVLSYREVEVNPPDLDPDVFRIQCPKGTEVVVLPCDAPSTRPPSAQP